MNKEELEKLEAGDIIHHCSLKNYDGSPRRYKITSIKTWKRKPDILIGLKRGLYEFYKLDDKQIMCEFNIGDGL